VVRYREDVVASQRGEGHYDKCVASSRSKIKGRVVVSSRFCFFFLLFPVVVKELFVSSFKLWYLLV